MKNFFTKNTIFRNFLILTILSFSMSFSNYAFSKNTNEIDAAIESALNRFKDEIKGSQAYLDGARGILVIPRMIKAGVILGMEYGEGALIVDDIIEMYKCGDSQYISNVSPSSYPDGLDVEVFSFEVLKLAYNQATDPFEREHVTPFIRNQSNIKQSNLIHDVDLSNLRWTLDEKEDFEVIKNIFNHFHPNIFFHWSKILELHEMKPEFFSANKRFIRNEA